MKNLNLKKSVWWKIESKCKIIILLYNIPLYFFMDYKIKPYKQNLGVS